MIFENIDTTNIDTYKNPKFYDIYFFNHLIPGIFAYILFHNILKYSVFKSFIIWIVIHTLYESSLKFICTLILLHNSKQHFKL